jgi:hypothetical protein
VTYAEELRTSYIDVHKRLWGNAIPAVTVNCEPQLKTSGNATGAMWQGLAPKVPFEPGSRKAVEIIAAVLQVTEICRRDFMSNRRTRNFVEARQLAYWFLRHHTKLIYAANRANDWRSRSLDRAARHPQGLDTPAQVWRQIDEDCPGLAFGAASGGAIPVSTQ